MSSGWCACQGPNGAAPPSWAPVEAVQLELAPSDGTHNSERSSPPGHSRSRQSAAIGQ